MCDRAFIPLEIMMWSVSIFIAVIFGGLAGYLIWCAIELIYEEFKGEK